MLAPLLSLVLAVLTAVSAAFVPAYYGNRKPGYSHVRDTISELGETGSPVGRPVSYVGFLAIGVLLWLFLIVAAHVVPPGSAKAFWALSLVGAGYVGGAILRCDPGAPVVGSWSNGFHNLFGFGEYVGAAAETTIFAGIVLIGVWVYRGGA